MASLFRSTKNTRALPTGALRFIRSDFPENLAEDEIAWLLQNGVTTLVDLRTDEEAEKKPCRLAEREGFAYIRLPVTGGGETPATVEAHHALYAGMLDAQLDRIVGTILGAGTGVLYFCSAGKDRTGIVSAALLRRLGADDETIIADYMESKENLKETLEDFAREHPELSLSLITPRRESIERVLRLL